MIQRLAASGWLISVNGDRLDNVHAAEEFDGSDSDYVRVKGLTPKELYQWESILTGRNLLTGKQSEPNFVTVVRSNGQ